MDEIVLHERLSNLEHNLDEIRRHTEGIYLILAAQFINTLDREERKSMLERLDQLSTEKTIMMSKTLVRALRDIFLID